MPTIVKTIGTAARNYSTIQAWEDALPVNLVTDGNAQRGECYNDTEFAVAGVVVTFSGSTADATNNITLTAATGQSFRDNASVQTNALRYNQVNGVGLNRTALYAPAVVVSEDFVTLRGLQIAHTGGGNSAEAFSISVLGLDNCVLEDCILESNGTTSTMGVAHFRSGTIRNCLLVQRVAGTSVTNGITFDYAGNIVCVNNTVVRPSNLATAGNALFASAGVTTVTNCALFGFTNSANVTSRFAGSNNASDTTIGFGTSNQASKVYGNQFQTTTNATRDFRLKTGADCVDTGVTDTTNGTPDIAGTARPSGASYDIGAWELVSAAATVPRRLPLVGIGAILVLLAFLLTGPIALVAQPWACPNCERDAHGKIKRSHAAIREFRRFHPCPATGKTAGRCPGYVIDHKIPLACATGPAEQRKLDQPSNMQWQTVAEGKAKDKTEMSLCAKP